MKIQTFTDILIHVNSDNVDQFLKDFEISLRTAINMKECLYKNESLKWDGFEWGIDGKPEVKFEIEPLDESVLAPLNSFRKIMNDHFKL